MAGRAAKGIFITGTDTGVGKTLVTAFIASILRSSTLNVMPAKPVQTGALQGAEGLRSPDLDFCLQKLGVELEAEAYQLLCPVRLKLAASPHLAARKEGKRLSVQSIIRALGGALERWEGLVLEGAGGVLVPLNERETLLDLMAQLGFPVLVVARAGLGTINHTLLTLYRLKQAGVDTLGVILCKNKPGGSELIEKDNQLTIEHFSRIPVLGTIPFIEDLQSLSPDAFLERALKFFKDRRAILSVFQKRCH